MKHIVTATNRARQVNSALMRVGEIGKIVSEGYHSGGTILRTFKGLVLLDDPEVTWTPQVDSFTVELYPVGTELRLVVGAGDI